MVGCAPAESTPNTLARAASVWFGFAELRAGRWNFPLADGRGGEGVRKEEGRLKSGHKGEENRR